MSRGPLPLKGIATAMPAALARGFVILCRHYYGWLVGIGIGGKKGGYACSAVEDRP